MTIDVNEARNSLIRAETGRAQIAYEFVVSLGRAAGSDGTDRALSRIHAARGDKALAMATPRKITATGIAGTAGAARRAGVHRLGTMARLSPGTGRRCRARSRRRRSASRPRSSARIATLPVREGQTVAAGAVLVTLDSPEVRAKVAQADAAQAAADAKRDLVDVGARAEDIRAARAQWDKATAGAELAEKTYQRLNALYKEGLVPLQRNDEAQTNAKAALETAVAAKAQYDAAIAGARPQEKAAASAVARQAAGGVAEVDAAAQDWCSRRREAARSTRSSCIRANSRRPGFRS